ncbi:alpha/beta hydrolase [Tunturiibacter empetritectus]|uniref:Pimeloyl-ACP methyl ester carboxylesterase n=1 Tax=Tunturiibacter lichenicola TaxID=2051959 RepID=A0A852V4I1_9BACT|nr:alpha/beta hydrolase [Edaphobacter lichenicola]NYF87958.1 pimeloyl-ACP methyl ester carboxylesterase [Edaphobacter lichenicola]
MSISRNLQSAVLAAGLAASTAGSSAVAQTSAPEPVKNVVLVHGAWVDGSSWSKVIPLLEAKGLHVVSVQIPLTSLADDVAATNRALALIDAPVILVGHSYGGVVITQAGSDPKVKGLVYIAAFAPDAGESVFSLAKSSPVQPPALAQIVPDSTGFTKISKQGIDEDFAEELSTTDKAVLFATQVPASAPNALGAPVTEVAWKAKPSWTLITLNDRVLPFQAQQAMAQRSGAHVTSVGSSHLVILAHPKDVAEVIERAANGTK